MLIFVRNAPKSFGYRAPPGPAGGAYSAPPNALARFRGATSRRGKSRKEKDVRERKKKGKAKGEKNEWRSGKGREGLCPLTLM